MEPWYSVEFPGPQQSSTTLVTSQLNKELGKYSLWMELMPRLHVGYSGFTETISNDQWNPSSDSMDIHGGYQCGDNWAEMNMTEMNFSADRGTGAQNYGRDIGCENPPVFTPDLYTEWPAEIVNPVDPDTNAEIPGETTEENLTAWCSKHGVDVEWFKTKYTKWQTTTITEQFVKSVGDITKKIKFDHTCYTGPTVSHNNGFGHDAVANFWSYYEWNYGVQNHGLRFCIYIPWTRPSLKR